MASTKPTVLLDHYLRQLTLTTMLWEYPSIAARMPTQHRYNTIGDLTIADAILDRTVHPVKFHYPLSVVAIVCWAAEGGKVFA